MTKLDYDVARIFMHRGERINPKKKSASWFSSCHTSNGLHIGQYFLWCHYDLNSTTVHISSQEKIPFKIANTIYEQFKDEKKYKPYFEYDGGSSENPSIIICKDELDKAINKISHAIFENWRIAYFFFSEETVKRIASYNDTKALEMCISELDRIRFIENMQKFEKRKSFEVDSIILYTMEELEFVLELLKKESDSTS